MNRIYKGKHNNEEYVIILGATKNRRHLWKFFWKWKKLDHSHKCNKCIKVTVSSIIQLVICDLVWDWYHILILFKMRKRNNDDP